MTRSGRPYTTDAIFGGAVLLDQPEAGYRFTIDAVLLAHEAASLAPTRFVDAGAGCGVVGLALAHLCPTAVGAAIELDDELAALARRNATRAGGRVTVHHGDVRAASLDGTFDVVVMNPPYYPKGQGRLNPDPQKAAARHQLHGDTDAWVRALAPLVARRGHIVAVYPTVFFDHLRKALSRSGFMHLAVRPVHPRPDADANVVLVTAGRGRTATWTMRPALIVRGTDNAYTATTSAMLSGDLGRAFS